MIIILFIFTSKYKEHVVSLIMEQKTGPGTSSFWAKYNKITFVDTHEYASSICVGTFA